MSPDLETAALACMDVYTEELPLWVSLIRPLGRCRALLADTRAALALLSGRPGAGRLAVKLAVLIVAATIIENRLEETIHAF
jgi:hypothetical protein